MKDYLFKLIDENKKSIKVFTFCLLLGLIVGIVSYGFLSLDNKTELISSVKKTLDICKEDNFQKVSILPNGIKSNIIMILILLLVSTTIIAPVLFCIIYFLKGFAIGIYITVIFSIFNFWNALLATFLINILPNIIYIPIYIYIGIKTIDFHYYITSENTMFEIMKKFTLLGYSFILSMPFIFLSLVIEQIMFSVVLNIYIKT